MRSILLTMLTAIALSVCVSSASAQDTFSTDRPDGRYTSSRAIAHRMMLVQEPRLHFRDSMNRDEFKAWQSSMAATMGRLMKHPPIAALPAPVKTGSWRRDGYTLEKWESYPLDGAAVPYLMLVPDGVNATNQAPAILCIPGFGQTKELLAGESAITPDSSTVSPSVNAMALHYVKEGYVAVAVDNPACGEQGDKEIGGWDYHTCSRALLELGWSYLGYASYIDKVILDWMKYQPAIRRERIVVSGFSLGTEPLMALGLMDPEIYAFVYNDFLCTTRERALVMTRLDDRGRRPWPNDIEHLIPEFLREFDFPDIVAALAPRPVICTEGGMDRDFNMVIRAYSAAGTPENFTCHHYAKYADPAARLYLYNMPEGIDRDTFFRLANVDPSQHYFKAEHIMPWLREILQ